MDFFKKLFSGSAGRPADSGMYVYVRPHHCAEVVRVRLDTRNDFSLTDDGTYFARKLVRANDWRCHQTVELEVTADKQRQKYNTSVTGGVLVTVEEYETWLAEHNVI
jgi:hypothetical protein